MDSEELEAPIDLEKVTKTESVPTGKSYKEEKSQRNNFKRGRVDSEKLEAPVDSEKVNKTTSECDAWIRKSSKPLLTLKKSTKRDSELTGKSSSKHLPKATRGFGRARSPC